MGSSSTDMLLVAFITVVTLDVISCDSLRWRSSTSGYWHDPWNWDANRVPTADDSVVIDAANLATVHPSPNIRLVNGPSPNEGRVEIFHDGEWGTVCDNGWDDEDAGAVCRSLGFWNVGAKAVHRAGYGQGSGKIFLTNVNCPSKFTSWSLCTYRSDWNGAGNLNCNHGEDAGVQCLPNTGLPSLLNVYISQAVSVGDVSMSSSDDTTVKLDIHHTSQKTVSFRGNVMVDGDLLLRHSYDSKVYFEGETNITGTYKWTQGSVESVSSGHINALGDMYIEPSASYRYRLNQYKTVLNVDGTCFFPSGTVQLYNGAVINIMKEGSLNISGNVQIYQDGNHIGYVYNYGTIIASMTSKTTLSTAFTNSGTVKIHQGTLAFTGSSTFNGMIIIQNNATLELSNGNHILTRENQQTGPGVVRVPSGVVTISSQIFEATAIDVVGGGDVTLSNPVPLRELQDVYVNNGKLSILGRGNDTVSDGSSAYALKIHKFTIQNRASVFIISDLEIGSLLQKDYYLHGLSTLDVRGKLTVTDMWRFDGGVLKSHADVYVQGKAIWTSSINKYIDSGTVHLFKTTTWDGGNAYLRYGASVKNDAKSEFVIKAGITLGVVGTGKFINHGNLTVRNPRPGIVTLSIPYLDNYGNIFAYGTAPNVLQISSNVLNTGDFFIPQDNTVSFTGSARTQSTRGSIQGDGIVHINGPTLYTNYAGLRRIHVDNGFFELANVHSAGVDEAIDELIINRGTVVFEASAKHLVIKNLMISNNDNNAALQAYRPTTFHEVRFAGGVITGDQDIQIMSTFIWHKGTIDGTGKPKLHLYDKFVASGNGDKIIKRHGVLYGEAKWIASQLVVQLNNLFEVNKAGRVELVGDSVTFSTTGNGRVDNHGSIVSGANNLVFGVQFNHYGNMSVSRGNLALNGESSVFQGPVVLHDSVKVSLANGRHEFSTAIVGHGTLQVSSGNVIIREFGLSSMEVLGGSIEATIGSSRHLLSRITVSGGIASIFNASLRVEDVVLSGSGHLSLNMDTSMDRIILTDDAILDISHAVTVKDEFRWLSGTIVGGFLQQASLRVLGKTSILGQQQRLVTRLHIFLEQNATWIGGGGIILDQGSVLYIKEQSLLNINAQATISQPTKSACLVDNRGKIMVSQHAKLDIGTDIENKGDISIQRFGEMELIGSTLTFGGNGNGQPCVFPFTYGGKQYSYCIDFGVSSQPWCATNGNYDGYKQWGKCWQNKGLTQGIRASNNMVIDENGRLEIRGGLHHFETTASLSGIGELIVYGGEVIVEQFSLEGTIQVSGGKLTLNVASENVTIKHLKVTSGLVAIVESNVQGPTRILNADVNGGTLLINKQVEFRTITMLGGNIIGRGNINADNVFWNGGEISGDTSTTLNARYIDMAGPNKKILKTRSLLISSKGKIQGDGELDMSNSADLIVSMNAELSFLSSSVVKTGTGSIIIEPSGHMMVHPQINATHYVVTIVGSVTNNGLLEIGQYGHLVLNGNTRHSGSSNTVIRQDGTLVLQTGQHIWVQMSQFTSEGNIYLSSGLLRIESERMVFNYLESQSSLNIRSGNQNMPGKIEKLLLKTSTVIIESPLRITELEVQAGTCNCRNNITVSSLQLSGGHVVNTGHMECEKFRWTSGTISGSGIVNVMDTSIQDVGNVILDTITLHMKRSMEWKSGPHLQLLTFQNNAHLIINKDCKMSIETTAQFGSNTNQQESITNFGTIVINADDYVSVQVKFVNYGTVIVESKSELRLQTSNNNRGLIQLETNSMLKLNSHVSHTQSVINGNGSVEFNGGSNILSAQTFRVNSLIVTGSQVMVEVPDSDEFSIPFVTIKGTNPLLNLIIDGERDLPAVHIKELRLTGANGGFVSHADTSIEVAHVVDGFVRTSNNVFIHTLHFSGGELQGQSKVQPTIIEELFLYKHKHKAIRQREVSIKKSIEWSSSEKDDLLISYGGHLVLEKNVHFMIPGTKSFSSSASGILTNYGSILLGQFRSAHVTVNVNFHNYGSVNIMNASKIDFHGGLTLTGTFSVDDSSSTSIHSKPHKEVMNITGGTMQLYSNAEVFLASSSTFKFFQINDGTTLYVISSDEKPSAIYPSVVINGGKITTAVNITFDALHIKNEGTLLALGNVGENIDVTADLLTIEHSAKVQGVSFVARTVQVPGYKITLDGSKFVVQKQITFQQSANIETRQSASFIIESTAEMETKDSFLVKKTDDTKATIFNKGMIKINGKWESDIETFNTGTMVLQGQMGATPPKIRMRNPDTTSPVKGIYKFSSGSFQVYGSGNIEMDPSSVVIGGVLEISGGNVRMDSSATYGTQSDSTPGFDVIVDGDGTLAMESYGNSDKITIRNIYLSHSAAVVKLDPMASVQKVVITNGQVEGTGSVEELIWYGGRLVNASLTSGKTIIQEMYQKQLDRSSFIVHKECKIQGQSSVTLEMNRESIFTVGQDATMHILTDTSFQLASPESVALLNNSGSISVDTKTVNIAVNYSDMPDAKLNVSEFSTIMLSESSTVEGKLNLAPSSTINNQGQLQLTETSSVLGHLALIGTSQLGTTLRSRGAELDIGTLAAYKDGSILISGTTCLNRLNISGGQLEIDGILGAGYLELQSGTLSVQGSMAVNGHSSLISGEVVVKLGGVLNFNGPVSKSPNIVERIESSGTISYLPSDDACSTHQTCSACTGQGSCGWHTDSQICVTQSRSTASCQAVNCDSEPVQECKVYSNQVSCTARPSCTWCNLTSTCQTIEECTVSSSSDVSYWVNPAGGNWQDASNWLDNAVPTQTDHVVIGLVGDYEIRTTANINVKTITIGSNCTSSDWKCRYNPTLRVRTALNVQDEVLISKNAKVIIEGDVTSSGLHNYGELYWYRQNLKGSGPVHNWGVMHIQHSGNVNLETKLVNYGVIRYTPSSGYLYAGNIVIVNEDSGHFIVGHNARGILQGTNFTNNGKLTLSCSSCDFRLNTMFTNRGEVIIESGQLLMTGSLTSHWHGSLKLENGDIQLHDSTQQVFHPSAIVTGTSRTMRVISSSSVHIMTRHFDIDLDISSSSAKANVSVDIALRKLVMFGDIIGSGHITVQELFNFRAGSIYGVRNITVEGILDFTTRTTKRLYDSVTLIIAGKALIQSEDITNSYLYLYVHNHASIVIESTGSLNVLRGKQFHVIDSSQEVNHFISKGLVRIGDGVANLASMETSFYGNISITNGLLRMEGNSNFYGGEIYIAPAGTLEMSGTRQQMFHRDVTLIVDGTLRASSNKVTIDSQASELDFNTLIVEGSGNTFSFTNSTNLKRIRTFRHNANRGYVHLTSALPSITIEYLTIGYNNKFYINVSSTIHKLRMQQHYSNLYLYRQFEHSMTESAYLSHNVHVWASGPGDNAVNLTLGGESLLTESSEIFFHTVHIKLNGIAYVYQHTLHLVDNSKLSISESGHMIGTSSFIRDSSDTSEIWNYGKITVIFERMEFYLRCVNYGEVNLKNGYVRFHKNSVNHGIYSVSKGHFLEFKGSQAHRITPGSELHMDKGSLLQVSDRHTSLYLTISGIQIPALTVYRGSVVFEASETSVESLLMNHYESSLVVKNNTLEVQTLNWKQGTITMGDHGVVNVRGPLLGETTSYSTALRGGTLNVYGIMRRKAATDMYIGGKLKIQHGGQLHLVTSNRFHKTSNEPNGEIYNYGSISLEYGTTVYFQAPFHNFGHINVDGRLVVNGGGQSSNGSLVISKSGRFDFGSGSFVVSANTHVDGTGSIYMYTPHGVVMDLRSLEQDTKLTILYSRGSHNLTISSNENVDTIIGSGNPSSLNVRSRYTENLTIHKIKLSDQSTMNILSQNTDLEMLHIEEDVKFQGIGNVNIGSLDWSGGYLHGHQNITVTDLLIFKPNRYSSYLYNTNLNLNGHGYMLGTQSLYFADSKFLVQGELFIHGGRRFSSAFNKNENTLVNHGVIKVDALTGQFDIQIQLLNYQNLKTERGNLILQNATIEGSITGEGRNMYLRNVNFHPSSVCNWTSGEVVMDTRYTTVTIMSPNMLISSFVGRYGTLMISAANTEFLKFRMDQSSFTLNVNASFTVKEMNFKAGTITGRSRLDVEKIFDWYNGIISAGDSDSPSSGVHIGGTTSFFSDQNKYIDSGTVHVNGLTFFNEAKVHLRNEGVLINNGHVFASKHCTINGQSNTKFINNGELKVEAGTQDVIFRLETAYENNGKMVVESGLLDNWSPAGETIYSGIVEVHDTASIQFRKGKYTFTNTSSLLMDGTIFTTGSRYDSLEVNINTVGERILNKLILRNGNVKLNNPLYFINSLLIQDYGKFTSNVDVSISSLIIAANGMFLNRKVTSVTNITQTGGTITTDKTRSTLKTTSMLWTGGTITSSTGKRLYFIVDNTFSIEGMEQKSIDKDVIVSVTQGICSVTSPFYLSNSAQFNIDIRALAKFYIGSVGPARYQNRGQITNTGEIQIGIDGFPNNAFQFSVPVDNTGDMKIFGSRVSFSGGGGSTSGQVYLDKSSVVEISGNILEISPNDVVGDGNFIVKSGVLRIQSGTLMQNVTVDGGELFLWNTPGTGQETFSSGTITVKRGVITVNDTFQNDGKIEVITGSIRGPGLLINTIEGYLSFGSNSNDGDRNLYISEISNRGRAEIISSVNFQDGCKVRNEENADLVLKRYGLLQSYGTLENAGSLTVNVFPDVTALIQIILNNYWLIDIKSGRLLVTPNNRAKFYIYGTVKGGNVTVQNTVGTSGIVNATLTINGNLAVSEPLQLYGSTTWLSGNIHTEDCVSSSYYRPPESVMVTECALGYVINDGDFFIPVSTSTRYITKQLHFTNRGHVRWEGGTIDIRDGSSFVNLPKGTFIIEGQGSAHTWTSSRSWTTFDNRGQFAVVANSSVQYVHYIHWLNKGTFYLNSNSAFSSNSLLQTGTTSRVTMDADAVLQVSNVTIVEGAFDAQGVVSGTVTVYKGHVSPGGVDIGALSLKNRLHLSPNAKLTVDLGDPQIPSSSDTITSESDCTVNGTLTLRWDLIKYSPKGGDTFHILRCASEIQGLFSRMETVDKNIQFDLSYFNKTLTATVRP